MKALQEKLDETQRIIEHSCIESSRQTEASTPRVQRAALTSVVGTSIEERVADAKLRLKQSNYTLQMYVSILKRSSDDAEKVHNEVAAKALALQEAEKIQLDYRLQQQALKQRLKDMTEVFESLNEKSRSLNKKHANRIEGLEKTLAAKTHQIEEEDNNVKRRKNIALRAKGDMNQHDEEKLKRLLVVKNIYGHLLDTKAAASEIHLQKLQRGFERIKMASGLSDVNAITERILNRHDNHEELRQNVVELRNKVDSLTADHEEHVLTLHQVQVTGLASSGNKEIYEEFDLYDEKLMEIKSQLSRAKEHRNTLNLLLEQCRACVHKVSLRLDLAAATQSGGAGTTAKFGTVPNIQGLSMPFDGLPDEFSKFDAKLGKMVKQVQTDLDQGSAVLPWQMVNLPSADGSLLLPIVTSDRDSSSGEVAQDMEITAMQQGHNQRSSSTLGTHDVMPPGSSTSTIGSSQLNNLLHVANSINVAPSQIPGNIRVRVRSSKVSEKEDTSSTTNTGHGRGRFI